MIVTFSEKYQTISILADAVDCKKAAMFTSYVSQQCYALPHGENRRTLYWRLLTDINKKNSREKRKWMYVSPLYPISAKGRGRCVEILFQKQRPQISDKIFYWGLQKCFSFFLGKMEFCQLFL